MRLRVSELGCLAAMIVVAGCTARTLFPSDSSSQRVSPDGITIYRGPAQVGDDYREVSVLVPGRDYEPGADDYGQMRKRAATLGANAVILDSPAQEAQSSAPASEYVLSAPAMHTPRVVAVVVGNRSVTAETHP